MTAPMPGLCWCAQPLTAEHFCEFRPRPGEEPKTRTRALAGAPAVRIGVAACGTGRRP